MIYPPLSSRERTLVEEVESRDLTVFTPTEASRLLKIDIETAYRMLSRLEDKEAVIRIERGKYIIRRFYSELDIYEIAPHIVSPSYLSMWSGLHYYGHPSQVPERVYLVVIRPRRDMLFLGRKLHFLKVKRRLFFGYRRFGRVVVAEGEKLLLDCLAFPRYAGGVSNILPLALDDTLDGEKLVEYAILAGNSTVCSRLGYLMEVLGRDDAVSKLTAHRSSSRILLDPSVKGKISGTSSKWNVNINMEV